VVIADPLFGERSYARCTDRAGETGCRFRGDKHRGNHRRSADVYLFRLAAPIQEARAILPFY